MIIYEYINDETTKVLLDNKYIGIISCISDSKDEWQYSPKNSKIKGEIFNTWRECKNSLEEE